MKTCPSCNGAGTSPDHEACDVSHCYECGGSGKVDARATVKIGTLRRGEKFTCASGGHWTYVRVDGASDGVHRVVDRNDKPNMFAACADVTRGWNDRGWMQGGRA